MNREHSLNEQMIALRMLGHVISVRFSEAIRDVVYDKFYIDQFLEGLLNKSPINTNAHSKQLI